MNWWKQQTIWIVGTLCVLAGVLGSVWGIELESSDQTGGPTPQELAEVIVDETAHLELVPSSASTAINTTLGSVSTNPRAIGKFFYGITSPGTDLPDEYQPDPQNPTLTYAGGIGIASGICLSTGLLTDDDDHQSAPSGYGIGVEGPNNGHPLAGGGEGPGYVNIGEVSADLQRPEDDDYVARVGQGYDATTLTFDIELHSPGILQITYVHGTDEWPAWPLSTYNDTFLALIKKVNCGSSDYENFIVFRGRNCNDEVEENLLSLTHLEECEFLLENYVPPIPNDLSMSDHANVSTTDLYDHEFGGFTVPLRFEATSPLPTSPLYRNTLSPGTYRIKLVIQDFDDWYVDSAAFIAANSLKLFPLAHGDYNGDGVVVTDDYAVWSSNFGTGTKFYEGDGNGDCVVDLADYIVWRNNLGNTGNADIRSDFNRDGCVNLQDAFILYSHANTESCAGRAQGDTDGDGDVDQDDIDNFVADWLTGCGSGLLMMGPAFDDQLRAAGIDIDSTLASTMKNRAKHAATKAANAATGALAPVAKATGIIPENPDVNGDGVVDQADLAILDAMILGESE